MGKEHKNVSLFFMKRPGTFLYVDLWKPSDFTAVTSNVDAGEFSKNPVVAFPELVQFFKGTKVSSPELPGTLTWSSGDLVGLPKGDSIFLGLVANRPLLDKYLKYHRHDEHPIQNCGDGYSAVLVGNVTAMNDSKFITNATWTVSSS